MPLPSRVTKLAEWKKPLQSPSEWIDRVRNDSYVRALIDTRADEYAQNAIIDRHARGTLFRLRAAHRLRMWRTIARGIKTWVAAGYRQSIQPRARKLFVRAYVWAKRQLDSNDTIK